jgi:hypothetical protein
MELYEKFGNVKTYYNFIFNPNEDKLSKDAKVKISHEFFPVHSRRPKLRRSVAQKIIKHFLELGVDDFVVADIMLFTIEIAQSYTAEKPIKQEAFYKSIYNLFQQTTKYVVEKGIYAEFQTRIKEIEKTTVAQNWYNTAAFTIILERLEY